MLKILNLKVQIEDKKILNFVSLEIQKGEIHTIMGPNGSGKSTLSNVIMGNPKYEITGGKILFEDEDVIEMDVTTRAQKGVFMVFQYPREITGVNFIEFLRTSYIQVNKSRDESFKEPSILSFKKLVLEKMKLLNMSKDFLFRNLNAGFSGGEKKKAEILQVLLLKPKLVILDEVDSGLDVDALRVVCESLLLVKKELPDTAFMVITHYQRILEYIDTDFVHVFVDGDIKESGGREFAKKLEDEGYEKYVKKKLGGSSLRMI